MTAPGAQLSDWAATVPSESGLPLCTISIVEPVTPELPALILVVPSAIAVATPPELILATVKCEADHDALEVKSLLDPSLKWPVAMNGWDAPGEIIEVVGVTVMV
jgi:hypothetical protein